MANEQGWKGSCESLDSCRLTSDPSVSPALAPGPGMLRLNPSVLGKPTQSGPRPTKDAQHVCQPQHRPELGLQWAAWGSPGQHRWPRKPPAADALHVHTHCLLCEPCKGGLPGCQERRLDKARGLQLLQPEKLLCGRG